VIYDVKTKVVIQFIFDLLTPQIFCK